MYYSFSIICSFLVAFLVSLIFGGGYAHAAGEIECKVLLAKARKAGKRPSVYYASEWGIIHIQTSREKCIEPIEVWKARHLKWKVIKLAKGALPPAIKSAKSLSSPIKKTLPKIQLPKAEQVFSPPPIPGGPLYPSSCNRRMDEFWFQGGHMIKAQFYWLSDVYTIDQNGDGIVDNVGFRLKSQGLPDMDIRYFAAKGKIQGSYIAKLKLVSDKIIPWLCFGRISFNQPPKIVSSKKLFKRPDLAHDMMVKSNPRMKAKNDTKSNKEGSKSKNKNKTKKPSGNGLMFWILAGLGILVIGGGGAFWFFKIRPGSGDEDEDDEDI